MRREHDVVHLAQRMIHRQRLDVEHVEAGARDLVLAQRGEHRGLVDDGAARGVDEVGRRLHQSELLRADEAACALGQDDVNGDEVGLPEQVVFAHIVDPDLLALLRRQVLAPGDHLHSERLGDLGGAGAELAEAQYAQRHAVEIHADRGLPWHAGLHPRVLVADAPGQLEHQADGDAGGRISRRRRAADHDAALLGGGDIDGCIAQPCRDEQLKVRQFLDDGAGEGGTLAHRAHDLEALQRLDHVLVAAEVLVEDLDVEIARNLRPVRYLEYDILVVVEDRAAVARHGECPWLARGWGGEDGAIPIAHGNSRPACFQPARARAYGGGHSIRGDVIQGDVAAADLRRRGRCRPPPAPSYVSGRDPRDQRFTRTGTSTG